MKKLEREFYRGKHPKKTHYEQLYRDDTTALYQCTDHDGDVYFEIFRIKTSPAKSYPMGDLEIMHQEIERYPKDDDFGGTAWCTRDFIKAQKIYLRIADK